MPLPMQLTLLNALYLILLTQAGFFGVFLLFQRHLLGIGIFFTALSVHMALNLGYENNLLEGWPNLTFAWSLLYPPSLYFYFRELLNRDFRWTLASFWHYLPWLLAVTMLISGIAFYQWLPFIMSASVLGYLIAIFYQFYRFQRIVTEQYSHDIRSMMRWSFVILINYTLIIFFDMVRSLIQYFSSQSGPWMDPLLIVLLLLLVNLMLIKRLTQPTLFKGISETDHLLLVKNSCQEAHQDFSGKRVQWQLLSDNLDQLMHEKALYKEAGITLKHVADELGVHSKKLSIAINQIKRKSFSEYIAELRIDAVKERLRNTDDAITSIFYDLGFSSKASFNTTFKKLVRETPSHYRARHATDMSAN